MKTTSNIRAKPRRQRRLQYYMITIHKHQVKDLVTQKELETVITALKYNYTSLSIINTAFESSGHYGQLHVHLVCKSNTPLRYTEFSSYHGYRIHYTKLVTQSDVHRAQLYVAKDQYEVFRFANAI